MYKDYVTPANYYFLLSLGSILLFLLPYKHINIDDKTVDITTFIGNFKS